MLSLSKCWDMFELSKQTTSINAILTGITMFVLKNKQQEINILVKQDYSMRIVLMSIFFLLFFKPISCIYFNFHVRIQCWVSFADSFSHPPLLTHHFPLFSSALCSLPHLTQFGATCRFWCPHLNAHRRSKCKNQLKQLCFHTWYFVFLYYIVLIDKDNIAQLKISSDGQVDIS